MEAVGAVMTSTQGPCRDDIATKACENALSNALIDWRQRAFDLKAERAATTTVSVVGVESAGEATGQGGYDFIDLGIGVGVGLLIGLVVGGYVGLTLRR